MFEKIRFSTKLLVVVTATALLSGFALIAVLHKVKNDNAIPLFTEGQPTLGKDNAPVHVIVFEDPRCNNCIIYHRKTFASLKKEFIDTGKVRYTVFLVSALKQSATISNYLFCIHAQSSQAFFTFLDAYYSNPPLALTDAQLLEDLYQQAKGLNLQIDLAQLTSCSQEVSFGKKVMDNTNYARAIMGGVIKTPSVFVNGIQLTRPSYSELKKAINHELNNDE
jgi:protein-disulfide isomerase